MENKTYTINTVPSLTWNWLKSNCDVVEINNSFSPAELAFDSIPDGITLSDKIPAIDLPAVKSGVNNIPDKKFGDEAKTAQNARITTAAKQSQEEIAELFNANAEKKQCFEISGKIEKPLILKLSADGNQITQQVVYAKENSEATIIMVYESSTPETSSTNLLQTKIYAENNATLNLFKIQLLNQNAIQLDDTQIYQADKATVKFTQIELGGQHVDSGLHVTLQGYEAKFLSNVAYLCQKKQYLDMNHIVYHYGRKSECDMHVNGTLKDEAIKTYRGTIDLKNGCCGSKGTEMEETLLLSPKVVNKSLPVILCDEEDVEGEHGATIGRLSADMLFYMQSRGIDEKSAEQIMAKAKIQAAADLIPDENIKELIQNWIGNN